MSAGETVRNYHDATKHHFHRFARALGYLDWASQPRPFRSFAGAPILSLPSPGGHKPAPVPFDQLYQPGAIAPRAVTVDSVGDLLRFALGLSAWKQFRESRWALRINPSSGNLHPTEAYLVAPTAVHGLSEAPGVFHYAQDRHLLEQRCAFEWEASPDEETPAPILVVLTSIHWREAWKYGERAFRYCQHDLGHAIAAIRFSAALNGWGASLLPACSHDTIAAIVGIDRDDDFVEAEREEPECILWIHGGAAGERMADDGRAAIGNGRMLAEAVRNGRWFGRASQLSEDHVDWTIIHEVARATRDEGHSAARGGGAMSEARGIGADRNLDAHEIVLRRRSAVAFDGISRIGRDRFETMLSRTMPGPAAPWDSMWWTPRIHLVLFVHRVDDLEPGLFVLVRDSRSAAAIEAAMRQPFLWERALESLPLFRLARGDCRQVARRLSCDQDIASDGAFSLGMIAEFDASLDEHGPSFYRHLFWESGVVGHVLYLEAEAAGVRATGIGCFYDDPVHELVGLSDHAFQSLYHFTVGIPVEDTRLTMSPGYETEGR